ncbi:MAG: NAD(P)/FAD-dependent oxidoreductase [Clostridia bacterium]|nr:NAD(P)/FAD-dependent oxidoreductase [Clostridia bacterium]
MIYDVLIIGAGITGTMTARRLAAFDLKVAVAEAGPDVAWGATKANSAIVHAGYDCVPGTLKAKLNVRGCAMMKEACDTLGVHYKNCGSHVVAFGEADEAVLRELYDRGIKNGVPDMKILTQAELREMEPGVSPEATASLWAPSAGIVCPYGLAIAAAENAATNGTEFFFDFKVTDVSRAGDVYYVTNGTDTLAARRIVNAAGVHSAELAKILGEHDFPVTITPRRGEYVVMDKNCAGVVNSTLFVAPSERGKGILVARTVDGNLLIGPNANVVEDEEDTSVTSAGLAEITEGAIRLVPAVNTRNSITNFAGVRATPSTHDFYIRASEQLPGVVHAVGVESPGLASSPATAEYITELLVSTGLTLTPRKNYVPTRRADGNPKAFVDMTDEERAAAIAKNPAYGRIICRCETVTEGDLQNAMRSPVPAKDLDMLKRRTRAGMGRCQGGFCSPRSAVLLANEQETSLENVTKGGEGSWLVYDREKEEAHHE